MVTWWTDRPKDRPSCRAARVHLFMAFLGRYLLKFLIFPCFWRKLDRRTDRPIYSDERAHLKRRTTHNVSVASKQQSAKRHQKREMGKWIRKPGGDLGRRRRNRLDARFMINRFIAEMKMRSHHRPKTFAEALRRLGPMFMAEIEWSQLTLL